MIVEHFLGTDIKTFVEAHQIPLGYHANRNEYKWHLIYTMKIDVSV